MSHVQMTESFVPTLHQGQLMNEINGDSVDPRKARG